MTMLRVLRFVDGIYPNGLIKAMTEKKFCLPTVETLSLRIDGSESWEDGTNEIYPIFIHACPNVTDLRLNITEFDNQGVRGTLDDIDSNIKSIWDAAASLTKLEHLGMFRFGYQHAHENDGRLEKRGSGLCLSDVGNLKSISIYGNVDFPQMPVNHWLLSEDEIGEAAFRN
ncbi:hypothetical protein B0T17DRAFT_613146 [Bombardia bombarda]|uniref:Uncharacterized protein n=1 Tax=Bombardia bombarda TaxID=252184 RepID=A0AA40CF25_9PEZI|nr:hypothetical protein B0T17DRAFT_613146 [Bombardia bombarda]